MAKHTAKLITLQVFREDGKVVNVWNPIITVEILDAKKEYLELLDELGRLRTEIILKHDILWQWNTKDTNESKKISEYLKLTEKFLSVALKLYHNERQEKIFEAPEGIVIGYAIYQLVQQGRLTGAANEIFRYAELAFDRSFSSIEKGYGRIKGNIEKGSGEAAKIPEYANNNVLCDFVLAKINEQKKLTPIKKERKKRGKNKTSDTSDDK